MIYGDRIRLRAIERSDLPNYVEWFNDPQVIAGMSTYWPLSMVAEERWFEGMLARPEHEQQLVIEKKTEAGWKHIGGLGFHNFNWHNRRTEIGILIGDKESWNQGYCTEAMRLALRYGFNTLNLNRISLLVFETNPGAIRCYEKVGFVLEGRLRQDEYREGKYVDILVMSVLREEWHA